MPEGFFSGILGEEDQKPDVEATAALAGLTHLPALAEIGMGGTVP